MVRRVFPLRVFLFVFPSFFLACFLSIAIIIFIGRWLGARQDRRATLHVAHRRDIVVVVRLIWCSCNTGAGGCINYTTANSAHSSTCN